MTKNPASNKNTRDRVWSGRRIQHVPGQSDEFWREDDWRGWTTLFDTESGEARERRVDLYSCGDERRSSDDGREIGNSHSGTGAISPKRGWSNWNMSRGECLTSTGNVETHADPVEAR